MFDLRVLREIVDEILNKSPRKLSNKTIMFSSTFSHMYLDQRNEKESVPCI